MLAFGTIAMPQVQRSGTAWECRLDDYAYTRSLDCSGIAWEFLRRKEAYFRDYRTHRAGRPKCVVHSSGAKVMRLRRRVLAAEKWGLQFFIDPQSSADKTQVFWCENLTKHTINCVARNANDNMIAALCLSAFTGRRAVLVTPIYEFIAVQQERMSASIIVRGSTFLIGESALTFEINGLEQSAADAETLRILRQLTSKQSSFDATPISQHCKYHDYLIALDGHLAGRSYRDIAEVLYGFDRIKVDWKIDRWAYKSKVRRAVECGLALMNGGYRDLL
jgi:Uncharacterized conserved protein (DUF2285)/Family of unknown function (DUF6499)